MKSAFKKGLVLLLCLCILMTTLSMPVFVYASGSNGNIYTMGPNPYYSMGQTLGIMVEDQDINTDPNEQQSVTAAVYSDSDPVGIEVELREEGNNSPRFIGYVKIAGTTNAEADPKEIKGENGDQIVIKYLDTNNDDPGTPVERSTVVTVADRVAAPVTNTAEGFQGDLVTIDLDCATVGAVVYYTMDGSEPQWPNEHTVGRVFAYDVGNMPQVNGVTVIKAIAVKQYMADSEIVTFCYNMLKGEVKNPEGAPIWDAHIDLEKVADNTEYLKGYPVEKDGSFCLPLPGDKDAPDSFLNSGRLPAGNYKVRAIPHGDTQYFSSDWESVTVNGDGSYNPSFISLTFRSQQMGGTVIDTDGNPVSDEDYEIHIRNLDTDIGYGFGFECDRRDNTYRVAGLADGQYAIRAVSRNPAYTDSFEAPITIENGNVTGNTVIALQMTTPQLTGMVDSTAGGAVGNGHVDIKDPGDRYLGSTKVESDGSFKLGGLADGTYRLTAMPPESSELLPSEYVEIEVNGGVCTPSNVSLTLQEKLLRVRDVMPLEINNDEIGVRLENIDLLEGNFNGLTASVSGGSLSEPIALNYDRSWISNDGRDGDFYFRLPGDFRLGLGLYEVSVKNNNTAIPFRNNTLNVIQRLKINPWVIEHSQYTDTVTSLELDVDMIGEDKPYPWNSGEELTVKIINCDPREDENELSVIVPENKILKANIPANSEASVGRRDIEIYRGSQLLARGGFDVGVSDIHRVTVNEGSDEVSVQGAYLESYPADITRAELWVNGEYACDSNETRIGGDLRFKFNGSDFKTGVNYTLKLFVGGVEKALPSGGVFQAVPRLDWSVPAFDGEQAKAFTISESIITTFGWSHSDNLRVRMHGPDAYDYTETNLDVGNENLIFTLSAGEGRHYPLQEGEYDIVVFRDNVDGDEILGYADVIVAYNPNDVLTGLVKASDGSSADGGYVNVSKEHDHWGERFTPGHNGIFHIWKNRMRGDGKYFFTAVPSEENVNDAPSSVQLVIVGGNYGQGITINLNSSQISGIVKDPTAENAVGGGNLDVFDEDGNWLQGVNVAADGTYKVGGLTNGRYYLSASAPWDTDYMSSDRVEVDYNGTPMTDLDIQLTSFQISGTARDFNDISLYEHEYEIAIRPVNNDFKDCEIKRRNGTFLIGRLMPGKYAVALEPRGESEYARSEEVLVNVDQNGVASPSSLTLKLTQSMLSGKVIDKNGSDIVDGSTYVEIWRSPITSGHLFSIPTDQYGKFNIGGIPEGDYYIRAGVGDYSNLFNEGNRTSQFMSVNLGVTSSPVTLELTDSAVPRIMWVNDTDKGKDRIFARVSNIIGKSFSDFNAEILDAAGSQLDPRIQISGDRIGHGWQDDRSDEADLELFIDGGINLEAGKYKLSLTYNSNSVAYDNGAVDSFNIAYPLGTEPRSVKPEDTQGMSLILFADDWQGGHVPDLWLPQDTLTATIVTGSGEKISGLACTKEENFTLTINVPVSLPMGWNRIKLYKGSFLLANGGIQVGYPTVSEVQDAIEGDNNVRIRGEYLDIYKDNDIMAEVLDISDDVLWSSNWTDIKWEEIEFRFGDVGFPVGHYKLRLKHNNIVVDTWEFKAVPLLACDPPAIAGTEQTSITVINSLLPDFRWSSEDEISVRIGGKDFNYEVDSGDLAFDAEDNLMITISDGDGHHFPLPQGDCWMDIHKNGQRVGHSRFVIGKDAITGTVFEPDGLTPVRDAKVRITNLHEDDYSSYMVTTNSKGKFYISKHDMPRKHDGNLAGLYSFLVIPPQGSAYASNMQTATINDPEVTTNVEISLTEPQISGTVKTGAVNTSGGAVEVFQEIVIGDNIEWKRVCEIDVQSDGSFNIGGLEDGVYYVKAREAYNNKQYVSSFATQVEVGSEPVEGLVLELNPVQVKGAALDPLDLMLEPHQYNIDLRPLEKIEEWNDERRGDYGEYRIGGLKPGKYAVSIRPNRNSPYTQSYEAEFTVKQDLTVDNSTINLQLTAPKFSGNAVIDATIPNPVPFTEGYVDIFNGSWQNPRYVTSVDIDENGLFRIGGIPNGTYYIRAAIWWDSPSRQNRSQSVMRVLELVDNTPSMQLSLRDKSPRIRWVEDAGVGYDRLVVHVVNFNDLDVSMLSAAIMDEGKNPTDVVVKSIKKDDWFDKEKDEGNLIIEIDGSLDLGAGKYNLKLKYNDNPVINETPMVNDFNGFNIFYGINVIPFAVTPEDSAQEEFELALDMDKSQYPWLQGALLTVKLTSENGPVSCMMEYSIAEDRKLTASLPEDAEILPADRYIIEIFNEAGILARGMLDVGYAKAEGIGDITTDDHNINIFGRNLILYMDPTTTARIYTAQGTTPIITSNNVQFMNGDMVIGFDGQRLAPGEYRLEMTCNGGTEIEFNGLEKFKVVEVLRAAPAYMLKTQATGQTVTLSMPDGSPAPWSEGDSLEVHISVDGMKHPGYYVIADVSDSSAAIVLPLMEGKGHSSIRVYKVNSPEDKIYIGYAHFHLADKIQLSGTVKGPDGNSVPYSFVHLRKKGDDKWGIGFEADAAGNYGIYEIKPGNYTVFASGPKGSAFIESLGIDIVIDETGNSSITNQDITLQPGRKISGKVMLPADDVAPHGGVFGWIGARTVSPDDKESKWYGYDVLISEGDNFADYTIVVPLNNDDYNVLYWTGNDGFVNSNFFYNGGASVFTLGEAETLNVNAGDLSGIDVTLAHGRAIAGRINLPGGKTAPEGGIHLEAAALKDSGTETKADDISASIPLFIPEGTTGVDYTLTVPAAGGYRVEYRIDPKSGYIQNGLYKSVNEMTFDPAQAAVIDTTDADCADIDMTLISAKYIKGTITLPEGYILPAKGFEGWVGFRTGSATEEKADDHWFGTGFRIENGNSIGYTVMVPSELNGFVGTLWCGGMNLNDSNIYYGSAGIASTLTEATALDFTQEINGINFALSKVKKITGTITIPDTAGEGGKGMTIIAVEDNGTETKSDDIFAEAKVLIPEGETSAVYTIRVPAASGYRVSYVADMKYGYEAEGFYSQAGTVFDHKSATLVDASNEATGIDLTVSNAQNPVCLKAAAIEDGTGIRLVFSKPLNSEGLSENRMGFALTADGQTYEFDYLSLDPKGTILDLHIKDYKIYRDFKDISLAYTNDDAYPNPNPVIPPILSFDGKKLQSFTDMEVTNKSQKTLSVMAGFASGALLNKNVVINVASEEEVIIIKESNAIIASSETGALTKEFITEGTHTVEITTNTRKAPIILEFTIDKTPPAVAITNPDNGTVVRNNFMGVVPVITFDVDCAPATKVIKLNGNTYQVTTVDGGLTYTGTTVHEAGTYVLTATAKDAAGNIRTVNSTFTVIWDTGSPVISIEGVTDGGVYENAAIQVSLAANAATLPENSNQSSYYYTVSLKKPDGSVQTFSRNTMPEANAYDAQGAYRFEVVAVNPSYTDRISSRTVSFTIDKIAPTAAIGNVTGNYNYNTAVTPVITFTDSIASQQVLLSKAEITVTRNGIAYSNYRIGDTLTLDGSYQMTVKTKDALNHESNMATVAFTIDRTRPVVTLTGAINNTTYKDQNVTITALTNEGSLTVVDGSGQQINLTGGQYTFTGIANAVTVYNITATAVDSAGNKSQQQLSFTIDRLPVNIVVSGVTEGMVTKDSPYITFTAFEGLTEKPGTTVTIDGAAFIGGSYGSEGTHTLVASYTSGGNTYAKTINFTIDKTSPLINNTFWLVNHHPVSGDIFVKAGDVIQVRTEIWEVNGVEKASFGIGSAVENKSLVYTEGGHQYIAEYVVESGNYDSIMVKVTAVDKAGNKSDYVRTDRKITIDNTKPVVSLITNPQVADGSNSIFRSAAMSLTLTADSRDTITWTFNGNSGSSTGSKILTPAQGTNVLIYHAADAAGNTSDSKAYVFEYDSIKPADVTLSSPVAGMTTAASDIIYGSVSGEGSKTGTTVLLKKAGEIVAKTTVKSNDSFKFDGVILAEGLNAFTLTAVDRAGNESMNTVSFSRTLDSTAPIITVSLIDDGDTVYYDVTSNEDILGSLLAKFNGVVLGSDSITALPENPRSRFRISTPERVEGLNTLIVSAADAAGNLGTGSFASTYIPPNTQQDNLPLNDNATMDIPGNAFGTQISMLVKTVDAVGTEDYKPLGAAISFEFKDEENNKAEPSNPLVIKNYIGAGMAGVVLMHVDDEGIIGNAVSAKVVYSTETSDDDDVWDDFDMNDSGTINKMVENIPYYVFDTGYLVFKTTNFSSYQVAQDNAAPEIEITTEDFEINKADKDAGVMKIAGTISDTDPNVVITEVLINDEPMDLTGEDMDLDESFSIPLDLTNGVHEVVIKAVDSAGNYSTKTSIYNVDITLPVLTATAAAVETSRNTVDIMVSTGENAELFINTVSKGYLNGEGTYSVELTDGAANQIRVKAVDSFGNTTEAAVISVTRDSTSPVITVSGVSNGDVYGRAVNIGVSVTDTIDTDPQFTITMDGAAFEPGAFNEEGQHTLVISAHDSLGNTSETVIDFAIDTSYPAITITGAENDQVYAENRSIGIEVENVSELVVTMSVDEGEPQNVTAEVEESNGSASVAAGTANEQHTYRIIVNARKTVEGQIRNAMTTLNFTVDRKKPIVASTTSDADTLASSINITGTVDEIADIYLNGDKVIPDCQPGTFTIPGQSLSLGANQFTLKAMDKAGNESNAVIININRNADTRSPVISITGAEEGGLYKVNKTLNIVAENVNELIVTVSVDGVEQNITPDIEGTTASANLTVGAAGEEHTYLITVTGNLTVDEELRSSNETFHLIVDRKNPVIVSNTVIDTTTQEAINITGTVDEIVDIYLNGVKVIENSPVGSFTIAQQSLNAGFNSFILKAVDEAGNEATIQFSITRNVDANTPVITITGAANNGIYSASKNVSIQIANAAVITATKSVDGGAAQNIPVSVTGTNGTAVVTLGTASEQHTYTIAVTAQNTVGGQTLNASSSMSFMVDMKKPVVTSTTLTQDTTAATINITGTVDEAADIYLNGIAVINNNPAGSFSIPGQALNTGANSFAVKAVDKAGNESEVLAISITRISGGGGGGGGGIPTGGDTKDPAGNTEDSTVKQEPVLNGETATAFLTADDLNKAISAVKEGTTGDKTVKLEIAEVDGAKAYAQVLPASVLKSAEAELGVEIASPLGTITIPGNMFNEKDLAGRENVGIEISMADKSSLDNEMLSAIGNKPVIELKATMDNNAVAWNNPDAPVTVSVPYTPTAEELADAEHIVVWYIDGNGKIIAVPNGRFDKATGRVTFTTTHFSKYAIAFVHKTFEDVKNSWAKKAIEVLASKGITSGTSSTTYGPKQNIIRADFMVLLVRTLGLSAKFDSNFEDIDASKYYYEAIGTAKKLGLTTGVGGNKYAPAAEISREDMFVLVARAMKLAGLLEKEANASTLDSFNDSNLISNYAKDSIALLVENGIVTGSNNSINPKGRTTREEMAALLYRVYNMK